MLYRLLTFYFLFLMIFLTPTLAADNSADSWTSRDMGEPGEAEANLLKLRLLPDGKTFPANLHCDQRPSACEFQLAYFLPDGFDLSKKQRLNILYIPGGPGAIVDSDSRSAVLRLLERKFNVVYFHPRGMAKSAIDGSKEYDQFLRADYVVEDIEKLRLELLKSRPWDAIYAHSWGTVIAQRYAAKYGKPKDPNPKVLSLILSGPVDRHLLPFLSRSPLPVQLKRIFEAARHRFLRSADHDPG
jgi:pimeloyl-ACP methyl ester carboxylesterase